VNGAKGFVEQNPERSTGPAELLRDQTQATRPRRKKGLALAANLR
jgi:hypothetical protein